MLMNSGTPFRRLLKPRSRPELFALVTAGGIAVWSCAIFAIPTLRFVVYTPRAKTGFDVSVALLSLFVALILFYFPDELERTRLQWMAVGFLILGFGALVFGYLLPVVGWSDDLNRAMYCSLIVRSAALAAMTIGLFPQNAPKATYRHVSMYLTGSLALVAIVAAIAANHLPPLISADNLEMLASHDGTVLDGLTWRHWALSVVPFGLALTATWGALRHAARLHQQEWIVAGMTLMAGSQLHSIFWPSAFSPILTTASILRLTFTLVVTAGTVLGLRRVALERAAVVAAQQDLVARLGELTRLRADFTAMVGHELASPIGSLQNYAAMLCAGNLDHELQVQTGMALQADADLLAALVADVRAAATERAEFSVQAASVALDQLLGETMVFARTLPEHPVRSEADFHGHVRCDRDRVMQVMRNLLGNVMRHTPRGTPVTLRANRVGAMVRIEVTDHGPGILPADRDRIFAKFSRGLAAEEGAVPGLGLGLYLSQRIVQAHGGELRLEDTPGGGATFWFTLPVATK